METDKTTLKDLSIFESGEESSVFQKLDFTRTVGGKEHLKRKFSNSLHKIEDILHVQSTLRLIIKHRLTWPLTISNGSILMIHKFFDEAIDQPPAQPSLTAAHYYRLFHPADFSLIKYSAGHVFEFIKGIRTILTDYLDDDTPPNLRFVLEKAQRLIDKPALQIVTYRKKKEEMTITEVLSLAHFVRYHYKQQLFALIELYFELDAWYGMAMAVEAYDLAFPQFSDSEEPVLEAEKLYHPLLPEPVAYDVFLNRDHNFIFLTGANMAGKSTFIKAVGSAVFLAHTGMGVPAKKMKLTIFDGLLSNINVVDNITKGESFFYNEVKRIKNTVLKINDGRKWLILIDELFKGTNVQDAMKCSTVVVEGLVKIRKSLFILSTHLYEIGNDLQKYSNIEFKYFETFVSDEKLTFSYQLRDGISNDRLGYLILKKEKVVELLDSL